MKNRSLFVPLACTALVAFGAVQLFAAVTESSTNVPLAIPDATGPGSPGTVNSTLNFSVNGTITDANLTVDIAHTWNDDIELRLTSPSIAVQLLWQDCGGSSDNTQVTIDQDAAALSTCPSTGSVTGTVRPTDGTTGTPVATSGTMDAFDGSMSGGVWTLNVTDDSNICTGTLNAWSLTLDGGAPLPVELMNFQVE
jgi:subtilisin-like proprotein convertase family protein